MLLMKDSNKTNKKKKANSAPNHLPSFNVGNGQQLKFYTLVIPNIYIKQGKSCYAHHDTAQLMLVLGIAW